MNSRKPRLSGILAGTALALLLGGPSAAAPLPSPGLPQQPAARGGVIFVQDEAAPEGEQPRKRKKREQQAEEQPEGEQKPRERRRREQQAEEQPAEGKGGERRKRQPQAEEQPGESERKPREQRRREQAQQNDGGDEAQPPRRKQDNESPKPDNTQQTNEKRRREQLREQQQAETDSKKRDQQKAEEEKRERQEAEQGEREKRRQQQAADKQRQQQAEDKQRKQQQAEGEQREKRREQQAAEEQRAQEKAQQGERKRQQQEAERQGEKAAPGEQGEEAARERPRGDGQAGDEAGQAEDSNRAEGRRSRREENAELPPGEAPARDAERQEGGTESGEGRRPRREQADNGPPPADDRAAQEEVRPERVESVDAEQGTRRRESRSDDEDKPLERERPRGTDVLREIGNRLILRENDEVRVESSDRPRLGRNARDVYTEDLPNERTRETVVRENGVRVVTIRNRYGDVIRRSRITPDGREYVLNYVDEEDTDRGRDWRDPGLDLPPFRSNVPEEDYILDAERAPSAEEYYEFLEKPPVERIERLYSLDEVKRSSRVRQKTRRIDLDTITFDFGSASVPEAQITKLEGVASAMERLLKENPAETFLIEGHTDAVGSDEANLALSDRRAESVAEALTNVFAIPPENLATQGYGEQYLKVQSAEPERENRRVAIRRITPLVAPVSASAQ